MSVKYRRLRLQTGWSTWDPGQFVMVRIPGSPVLIRRPFGIVGIDEGVLEICFKVIGPGTQGLAHVQQGDKVDVLGPLGHGFETICGVDHMLIAGGYGIAPLLGLARMLVKSGEKVTLFYGAKNEDHLLYGDELSKLSIEAVITTEDGSVGQSGLVTEAVEGALSKAKKPVIYACGPRPLMKAVAELGEKNNISVQVSLDEYMACGIGVCLGCMIEKRDGTHVRACREGPVFNASELKW